jgi:putative ABC transport system permease protein
MPDHLRSAPDIGIIGVFAAASLMLVVFSVSAHFRLGLGSNIAIASVRTVLQLAALGAILYPIFDANVPQVVLPYLLLMATFATREASVKPKYRYGGMRKHLFVSVVGGLALSFTVASLLVMRPAPWWNASTMIPVCGMLLGGCVNALSLGTDKFLTALVENGGQLDALLHAGATAHEAALPGVRAALSTGLTPTLNQMNVIGLVSIPGMMTGQVLGGSPPLIAAK